MKKRLYIIHGWVGSPREPLFVWLKSQADKIGFETCEPEMPNTDAPEIDAWVGCLSSNVGALDENTYFIGHSIGCQAILRYLAKREGERIGGAVFIAPWLTLTGIDAEADKKIVQPWLDTAIAFQSVKMATNKFTAIFSDNDPFVPIQENIRLFKERFDPKIIIEHAKGHFTEGDGVVDLPSASEALRAMVV